MLHVPGNIMSLEQARQQGADIQDVYDVTAALKLKESKPDLVFFGIGFETTTPMTAWAIKQGLTVYSSHKLFPPAMSALLANPKLRVDGFINPGHVSAIIGTDIYNQFKIPQAITGFEAVDILLSIKILLEKIINNQRDVANIYGRVVRKEGNYKAREAINDVFEISSARWRGLGTIPASGLEIRKKYQTQDAKFIYQDLISDIKKDIKPKYSACQCGQVLQGMIEPKDCKLFGKICNPDNPQGACMVSTEGSCQIAHRYSQNS
jgi:hydrogenase expression/formation protein HypD